MIAILTSALVGALWRRVLGGYGGKIERWAKNLAAVAIFVPTMVLLDGGLGDPTMREIGWSLAMSVIVAAAVLINFALGHGSYMDLGSMPIRDNEWLKPVLDLIWPEPPFSRKRDALGLALNYSVEPVVIVAVTGFWPALLAGPLVAAAYVVAHRCLGDKPTGISFVDGYTAVGELASGALLWGFAVAAFVNLGG